MTDPGTGSTSLSRNSVAYYAAAVGPLAILGLPFSVYLPPYIAQGGAIPVAAVGLIFSICTLWDGFVDPAIGSMIDRRHAGPAPHRRWMRLAIVPFTVLLILLVTIGDTFSFVPLLALLLVFYSSLSLYDVAHLAWGSALANNATESSRLFGAREWASKLILVPAFGAPALAQALIPGLDLQGRILAYATMLALALPIALFAVSRTPPRPVIPGEEIGWKRELLETVRFRPLILLVIVQLLNAFAFGALTSLFVFYADGALDLDGQSALLLFATFIGGAVATPFWSLLAVRLGKPVSMIAMCAFLISMLVLGLLVPTGSFQLALAFSATLGSGFVGLVFIYGMAADLAPVDRQRCGRDRTAYVFALVNVMQRGGVALAIAVSYALLDAMGFKAADAAASGETIRLLFTGLPSLAWLLCIATLIALARQMPSEGATRVAV